VSVGVGVGVGVGGAPVKFVVHSMHRRKNAAFYGWTVGG
jgi:hypothetical protein